MQTFGRKLYFTIRMCLNQFPVFWARWWFARSGGPIRTGRSKRPHFGGGHKTMRTLWSKHKTFNTFWKPKRWTEGSYPKKTTRGVLSTRHRLVRRHFTSRSAEIRVSKKFKRISTTSESDDQTLKCDFNKITSKSGQRSEILPATPDHRFLQTCSNFFKQPASFTPN